uniref:Uncharacterized protein n=1 Tax=Wuchereria bancrofti TaxID=6293 RepID=A0A1I8EJI8_WUCBA
MPFLKIDFSTHDSNNHIQKHLRAQFSRYFWPVQLVLALLCCRFTCLRQKNRRRSWIAECHMIFIIFFLIIILLITTIQFWYDVRTTTANPPEIAVSILQLQGVLNLCFLVYWDVHSVGDKLRQRLQSTSTGIGVLRRKSLLDNIHLGAIISGIIISLVDEFSSVNFNALLHISSTISTKSHRSIISIGTDYCCSNIISLLLYHDMTHFRYLLIVLIAGTSALQEQTYSVAIAYINHLYRSPLGISFFEITVIDRRFIEKAAIIVLLLTAIYYFNNYDKHPIHSCSKTISEK